MAKTKTPHGTKPVDLSLFISTTSNGMGAAVKAIAKPTHGDFKKEMDEKAMKLALEGKSRREIMNEIGMGEFQARRAIEAAKLIKAAAPVVAAVETPQNREGWLNTVANSMAPWFTEVGAPLTKFRVSIGFSSKGSKSNRVGECWTDAASVDKHHEIFIRPDQSDSVDVAAILAHELVHAAVGIAAGHGKDFRRVALAIGLEGKMKATVAGEKFRDAFAPILAKLGPIPHASLNLGVSSGPKKQTTRMFKVECPEDGRAVAGCGYVVRMTQKWARIALPSCPNPACACFGETMIAPDLADEAEDDENEDGGGEDE